MIEDSNIDAAGESGAEVPDGTPNDLFELVYDELYGLAKRQMRQQSAGHTLQPTALVNELYLKLSKSLERGSDGPLKDRDHFIGLASRAMRSILVDHARAKGRQKRKADGQRVPLEEAAELHGQRSGDLVALDDALERLAERDPSMVKLVELRFFGGCSMEEAARLLDQSLRTTQREWRTARAWLRREIEAP